MLSCIVKRIARLIDVKSIITLSALGVYLGMEATGMEISSGLNQLITIIIAFYFGTQSKKGEIDTLKGELEHAKEPEITE